MSLNSNGDLESKARSRRSLVSVGDYHSWESLAAHDDDNLEAYTSPWNALEEMYWQNSALGGGGVMRNSDLRKRQDVKTCNSGGSGSGGGNDDGGDSSGGGNNEPSKPPAPRQVRAFLFFESFNFLVSIRAHNSSAWFGI